MYKPVLYVSTFALFFACNDVPDTRKAAGALVATHKTTESDPVNPLKKQVLTSTSLSEWLNNHHVSGLFQEEWPSQGFLGEKHERVEHIIFLAKKDTKDHKKYAIEGKTRYQNRVSAFQGKISIDSVYTFAETAEGVAGGKIFASMTLNEDKKKPEMGQFVGKMTLKFVEENGAFEVADYENLKSGNAYEYQGTWTAYKGAKTSDFHFMDDFYSLGNQFFSDFSTGDAEPNVNEKYADLGWTATWYEEEWW